ncbi:MAG: RdgB/HAM1 family non-canonical purine NTP pyrophosphatase [Mycoplasmataceae bacterium]|jgi:XTP/dITP diphosphohydrolase|nr:RdgB/HAM1 family non-canonical purine NTP pyrophosphatase [Mycoplasmataceae bacterium]
MKTIVVATNNFNKFKQISIALAALKDKYIFKSLREIRYKKPIAETGTTFEENSLIKARQVAKDTNCITIADDSGIEIDAMDKEPGVYAARFAQKFNGAQSCLTYILEKLQNAPESARTARFHAVISLVFPSGEHTTFDGVLEGKIGHEIIKAGHGLTYDPIFIPNGYDKPLSVLTSEERVAINHRGIALRKLLKYIEDNPL